MPNRILKDSICTSENVDCLSAFQETFFYRLIVNCDDYGRMDARPRILAARLFPLKDIRSNQIEDALRALTSAELVILYEVDGKPFLQMKTWDKHQQVRAQKSKYPSPDEAICNQLISNDSKCPRNPIQSEYESNPNTNTNTNQTRTRAGENREPQNRFHPPTREELTDFCREQGLSVDVDRFLDYYTSNGWRVGKNPMKDWKATARNWARGSSPGKTVSAQAYEQRDYSGVQDELMAKQEAEMRAFLSGAGA